MRNHLLLALALFAPAALAQPVDLYGFTPRSVAMAGLQASARHDFTAAYYNPALLDDGSVGVGFAWGAPNTWVEQTAEPVGSQQLVVHLPSDYAGVTLGAAVPLTGRLTDRATLGFAFYVPARQAFRSNALDEATAHFLRYDTAPNRFQFAAGLSARPLDWLSLGVGAQLVTNYAGTADFTAVLGTTMPGRVTQRSLGSEVTGALGPEAGLAVRPSKNVQVLAFWRGELEAAYTQPIYVDLGTFGLLAVNVAGITEYAPHQAGLGVAVDLLDGKLLLGADLGWEHWAVVPSLVTDISIDLPQTLQDLGFDPEVLSRPADMGFRDVLVPRVGAQWQPRERLTLRAGYFFRPSPVPPQSGRTNFMDSDAHVLSAGGGWAFDDPLQMAKSLSVEGGAQLTLMGTRAVEKDGPNKSPNYRFGGTALCLSVALRYGF